MKKIPLLRNGLITVFVALGVLGGNVASAEPFAYVTHINTNIVSVIDIASNNVADTVEIPQAGAMGIALTPDGSHAYVAGRGIVSVIDTTSNTVVDTIIGEYIYSQQIAITPDGSRAYVSYTSQTISVINTTSNTIVDTISNPVNTAFHCIGITPDGSRAYAGSSSFMWVIDTSTNVVLSTIGIASANDIAFTPDSSRAYVVSETAHRIDVINTASNTVVDTISVGLYPHGIAITPDGSRAYVANQFSNSISVIDTVSNTVVDTIPAGNQPSRIAITQDGSFAYVSDESDGTILVIDTASNTIVDTVTLGYGQPDHIAITPDTNKKPVAHAGADQAIILLNTEVQLDGTGSYDEDGDPITYAWSITQKPAGSSVLLSNPASATPTFTPDVYGDYVIELTVSDPTETGSTDSVTVSFDNVKPVANAGGNKSLLVGDTAVLDGTGSTDANGDPLTFNWSFVSKPAESTTTLSGSTSPTTSFVADVSGTYDVNLTVNDGLLDSDPDTASILAITVVNAITQVLNDAIVAINNIPPEGFRNPKLANALTNKINAVLKMIEKEQYQGAFNKLTKDILTKADGCANGGEQDKTDWIKTCAEQDAVHSLIMETISIVQRQL